MSPPIGSVVVVRREHTVIQAGRGVQGVPGPNGPQGPAGPAGPPGPAGGDTYTHTQSTPAAVWTITHNLQRYPSVTVVDSAGRVVEGDVEYLSPNQVRLTFAGAFSGAVYLN